MTEAKVPAVLISSDDQTLAELKSALAEAMGTARVEIGPRRPDATVSDFRIAAPGSAHLKGIVWPSRPQFDSDEEWL